MTATEFLARAESLEPAGGDPDPAGPVRRAPLRIRPAGSGPLDPGRWIRAAGSGPLDPGRWIRAAGSGPLDPGRWIRADMGCALAGWSAPSTPAAERTDGHRSGQDLC
ncbi:hypothetical protein ACU4GR_05105 [Methylobacterium oryzae CBMB20]